MEFSQLQCYQFFGPCSEKEAGGHVLKIFHKSTFRWSQKVFDPVRNLNG